jgi:hypothetical protein
MRIQSSAPRLSHAPLTSPCVPCIPHFGLLYPDSGLKTWTYIRATGAHSSTSSRRPGRWASLRMHAAPWKASAHGVAAAHGGTSRKGGFWLAARAITPLDTYKPAQQIAIAALAALSLAQAPAAHALQPVGLSECIMCPLVVTRYVSLPALSPTLLAAVQNLDRAHASRAVALSDMSGLFSTQAIDENDPVDPFTLYGTVLCVLFLYTLHWFTCLACFPPSSNLESCMLSMLPSDRWLRSGEHCTAIGCHSSGPCTVDLDAYTCMCSAF